METQHKAVQPNAFTNRPYATLSDEFGLKKR